MDWGTLFHPRVINQGGGKKAVRNRNWESQHAFAGSGLPSVRSYRIFGTHMSSQAHRSPLMIKPPWQICVCDTWQTGVCVWFSWPWMLLFIVQQNGTFTLARKRQKFSNDALANDDGKRTSEGAAPPFTSCLFLWLLKAHYASCITQPHMITPNFPWIHRFVSPW